MYISEELLRAFAAENNLSIDDPNLRRLYELDMSARRDEASVIKTVEDRVRLEERTKSIRMMLANGFSEAVIYKYYDAPRSEIAAIIAKLRAESRN